MATREAAYALVEAVLNRYMGLDPAAKQKLSTLRGRVILLRVQGPDIEMYLMPGPHGIQVFGQFDGAPDCVLTGTPFALSRLGRKEYGSDELFKGGVGIEGDTDVGHRFGEILAELDVDWEEQLSRLTGDVIAHQVGTGVRAAANWGAKATDLLLRDLAEYLQEESRLLPTRFEVEEFAEGVETLRDDVERLEARVARLRARSGRDREDDGEA